jgi:outer membrane protein
MHPVISAFFALFLLCLFPFAAAADETISLKLGYVILSPDGRFASTESGVVNTEIDLEDDLDFGDSEGLMAEAALQLGSFRLSIGYLPLDFSGTSNLTRDITFEGETFSVSDTVKGEMDLAIYDVGLTWNLLNFDDLPVRLQLGPELSVKVVDGEVSLSDQTTGMREEISGTVPVPTIGLRGRIGLSDYVALIGRVGYVGYSDNSFLDADAQIEFSPLPMVGIFGGYRYLDIDVDESDLFIDATFSGPYAGAFVRF